MWRHKCAYRAKGKRTMSCGHSGVQRSHTEGPGKEQSGQGVKA